MNMNFSLPKYVPDYGAFEPGETTILYSGPFWSHLEIEAATEALLTGKWLTSGERIARFQNEFGRRFHARHCHMVNSGSSANLVMIAAVKKRLGWKDGDEVIVSPVGFPTTFAPLIQNGLKPVFVDIEMNTLNFDLEKAVQAITARTKAIFVSPVLGNPPDMDRLRALTPKGVTLLGDHCDSLGTKWRGQLLNELYYAWSTSFYPAHHITTGQGGMVCSDDSALLDIARSIATWGRDCYCVGAANTLPCGTCGKRFSDWLGDGSTIDHKYIFSQVGYNLNPALDLQGAIGLIQLAKFDEIENKRRSNFRSIAAAFEKIAALRVAASVDGADPCWFGVPLICDSAETKDKMVAHLEAHKIQTRPYFAGNILRHPAYKHLAAAADFPNADLALSRVFFIGCPPHYTQAVIDYIGEVVSQCA